MELDQSVHPYYVAVQYHPEYISRPMKPSEPYLGLILAATGKLNHFLAQVRPYLTFNGLRVHCTVNFAVDFLPTFLSLFLPLFFYVNQVTLLIVSYNQGCQMSPRDGPSADSDDEDLAELCRSFQVRFCFNL